MRDRLKTYLSDLLNVSAFSDYCENGLQVEGKKEVVRLATAVSASLETIQMAVEKKMDALLVHHGLFWKRDSYAIFGTKKNKIIQLLQNEISLFAYHLPLDAHQEFGNNWRAAKEMQWRDLEPFCLFNGIPIGVKGHFSKMSRENFQKNLEEYYQHPAHCALGGKKEVESAALISGGAYRNILDAVREGVDCFITGNFDEPAWHQAFEEEINFFALGHSATERIGPRALGEHLQEEFGLDICFFEDKNPF